MNTRLTFLIFATLALPLVSIGAQAQAKDDAQSAPAATSGRQLISNKLERIRLDTVRYDNLPLSEVVLNLRDEAKKRDPEKKGINFMLNPNTEASAIPTAAAPGPIDPATGLPLAAAAPQEQVDISSIAIKITPPLNDVRLVDALDAVVKVADHPIKYTVEDYGVVFSLKVHEPSQMAESIAFFFPGGTPAQFLDAVQRQYNVDWASVADIPKEMADVRIPKLRIYQESVPAILAGKGVGSGPLGAVVSLYNQLWENNNALGRLVVKGDLSKPSIVMFVRDPAGSDPQRNVKVKAFSIYGINNEERAKLIGDIDRAKLEAMEYESHLHGPSAVHSLEGTVAIHNDTSLLVCTGPESFVDMVESIVNAFQAKEQGRNPSTPAALPNPPGK
jgi:hypothetical protein